MTPDPSYIWKEFLRLVARVDELYRRLMNTTTTTGVASSTTSSDCDEWVVLKDGGSNGAVGSWPTLTYTLKDKNSGATIATGVAMTGRGKRLSPMPITEGTHGRGYYNSVGDPVLTWVDETYDYNFCIGS